MKKLITLLFIVITSCTFAQFTEDFSDGDFSSNPTWSGDVAKFTIENEELRSNSNTASDVFYLSTASTLAQGDLEWRFRVNMKFSTSGANYTDVYLMADNADLTSVANGYFVRIGNTKDEASLYKVVAGTETQLTDGTDSKTHNKNINIKVTKGAFGTWAISADYAGGTNYELEGTVTDNDITASSHFGFYIKQSTASFHLKHFYDDIYVGPLVVDTQKPTITSSLATNDSTIVIIANEPVTNLSATFTLDNGYGTPANTAVSGADITLTYNTKLINNNYILTINDLKDLSGNSLDTAVTFNFFQAKTPSQGELILTEIFADPTPAIGLPNAEYIEILNTSTEPLQLENCTFSDGGTPAILPNKVIQAGDYLIISKSGNESLFTSFGDVIGIDGFPALNNNGDNLVLADPNANLIEAVNYTDDFYRDDIKKAGGYSLERIDFFTTCFTEQNWTASNDPSGGTPGIQNSVFGNNPDTAAPQLLSATITGDNTIALLLDEHAIESTVLNPANYNLLPNNEAPNDVSYDDLTLTINLTFTSTLEPNTIYNLEVLQLEDCIGNNQNNILTEIVTTTKPSAGDILINELLFNPTTDGVDFIELYNNSEKYIDLSEVNLGRFDEERKDVKPISSISYILYPNQYVALTTDTVTLNSEYNTQNLYEVNSLPAMNNDEGTVLLLNNENAVLDSVPYDEEQHFELLNDVNGVSLERNNFNGESYNTMDWHSASSSVGFATPGYQNSQFIDLNSDGSSYSLVSNQVSPDGDGYQDLLTVEYARYQGGYTVNGYVFNLAGRLVHQPINGETLGTSGTLTWDGVIDNGTKTPVGNYILLLETFNLEGKVEKKKLAFSIIGRF